MLWKQQRFWRHFQKFVTLGEMRRMSRSGGERWELVEEPSYFFFYFNYCLPEVLCFTIRFWMVFLDYIVLILKVWSEHAYILSGGLAEYPYRTTTLKPSESQCTSPTEYFFLGDFLVTESTEFWMFLVVLVSNIVIMKARKSRRFPSLLKSIWGVNSRTLEISEIQRDGTYDVIGLTTEFIINNLTMIGV